MKRLYLIRHGEAAPPGVMAGQANLPLTAAGKAQIRERQRELACVTFSAAWSSPLVRALRSAAIILEGNEANTQDVVELYALREISLGLWNGRAKDWIREGFPQEWAARGLEPVNYAPPGGKNFHDLAARVLPAFNAVLAEAARHENSLLSAHQAVNRVIIAQVTGLPLGELLSIPQPPAALSIFEITAGGARLLETR